MYLYEKNKDKIDVYELKEKRDKLFEFKRKEMEKINKHNIVYNVLTNDAHNIFSFKENGCDNSKLIVKENKFFIHKKGIKLENLYYLHDNEIIIDGLIYQVCNGMFDIWHKLVKLYKENEIEKYFLITNDVADINKKKLFKIDGEFYKYKLSNVVNIPEKVYLLQMLIRQNFDEIIDKNIDEQLSLYDFEDTPIKKLDLETLRFTNRNTFSDKELEVNQKILKKVRQINK